MKFIRFLWQCGTVSESFYISHRRDDAEQVETALVQEEIFSHRDQVQSWIELWKNTPELDLDHLDAEAVKLIPEPLVRKHKVLAHHVEQNILYVAAVNPLSPEILTALSIVNYPIVLGIAVAEDIERLIEKHYRQTIKAVRLAERAENISAYEASNLVNQTEYIPADDESYIIQLLDTILEDALNLNASDIHIEADSEHLIVRYRLSGNLLNQLTLSKDLSRILVRHILARSDANLAEFRLPQDSSFRYNYKGSEINIRVSVLFGYEGTYSIVLRLLMAADQYQHLTTLIQDKYTLDHLLDFLHSMNGMMIIAGPTSSGKTTLLYNALSYISNSNKKILTVEDPVEAMLPNLTQIQTIPEIGLDFASVIRSSLRQNPDVMMLGEMRDTESASMAMRAAITGVMVMSTLHTKNVISTVLRLMDLDIELPVLASAVKMIISTRLVRLLCDSCKQPYQPTKEELLKAERYIPENHINKFCKPVGCEDCLQSGYQGLLGVYETLRFTPEMANDITTNKLTEFKKKAFSALSGKEFGDKGAELWTAGQTSYDELIKLIFVS